MKFTNSVRSSVKSMLDEVVNKLNLCAKYTKGHFEKKSEYRYTAQCDDFPRKNSENETERL